MSEVHGCAVGAGVEAALREGRPAVGLETAVLTHGLPHPAGLETLAAMQAAVRETGAEPAVVGVLRGVLRVGLDTSQLEELVASPQRAKASARDLAWIMSTGRDAGTTVAATMVACRRAGLRVVATGGIGGVHRGWSAHPDVSADLAELARSPVLLVSSGAKSVLDLPATLEALESFGIPVLGWQHDWFPQFHSRGVGGLPVPHRCDHLGTLAAACRAHWRELDRASGVLLVQPVPAEHALPQAEVESAVATACAEAESAGVRGSALTPFLLDALARITGGRSLAANRALLTANARFAARAAVRLLNA